MQNRNTSRCVEVVNEAESIRSAIRSHPLGTYAKFSEKLTWKILRTYLIDDPLEIT